MIALKLNFKLGDMKGFKAGGAKETRESKGKPQANNQNSNTAHNNNNNNKANKSKEKGYRGKSQLMEAQREWYRKDNKCFKCWEQGHVSHVCPRTKV